MSGRPPAVKIHGRPCSLGCVPYSCAAVSPRKDLYPGDILEGNTWVHFPPLASSSLAFITAAPTLSQGLEKLPSSTHTHIHLHLSQTLKFWCHPFIIIKHHHLHFISNSKEGFFRGLEATFLKPRGSKSVVFKGKSPFPSFVSFSCLFS